MGWIQFCDKKKNIIKLAKGLINDIFQDLFNKILFQQLTHDRFYISGMTNVYLPFIILSDKCVWSHLQSCDILVLVQHMDVIVGWDPV